MNHYIGIDIAKASLQVYIPEGDLDIEIENSVKGLKKLQAKLKKIYKKHAAEIIWIYEPTGAYWSIINRFCNEQQIKCFIVKGSQSHAFAKSIKNRNKNDIVDARMLYRMQILARDRDIKIPEYDEEQERLKNYIRYYKSLVKERVSKINQLDAALAREDESFIIRKFRMKIKNLKVEEKETIAILLEFIKLNENNRKKLECITSFKGVGELSGAILFEFFSRYKDASAKQIVALAGLDPIEVSSGSSVHKRSRISKQGSRLIRSTLFMGTMISIEYNPEMKLFYERLKSRGKHSTSAQIAVMRKIVTITFALYKQGQMYEPDRYEKWNNLAVA